MSDSAPTTGPKDSDAEVIAAAAKRLSRKLTGYPNIPPARWAEMLAEQPAEAWYDPYTLARSLEDTWGLSPNWTVVNDLRNAGSILMEEHDRAREAWVRKGGFSPAFKVGDRVSTPQGEGTIYEVDECAAMYTVDTDGTGDGGFVLYPEELAPVPVSA
jgi:hypothetical protein